MSKKPKSRKGRRALTARELGKILYEEFERDNWGTVDPFHFSQPVRAGVGESDYDGLYEVLDRAAKRIKKHFV